MLSSQIESLDGLTGTDLIELFMESWMSIADEEIFSLGENSLGELLEERGAQIEISGRWEGWVLVSLSAAQAQSATAQLFQLPQEKLGPNMEQDFLKELTNIFAGALKGCLGADCSMSLPEPWESTQNPKGSLLSELYFEGASGPLRLRLFLKP